ncbi:MAG: hypothetical protein ACRDCB_02635, partial [Clostridium sp.]
YAYVDYKDNNLYLYEESKKQISLLKEVKNDDYIIGNADIFGDNIAVVESLKWDRKENNEDEDRNAVYIDTIGEIKDSKPKVTSKDNDSYVYLTSFKNDLVFGISEEEKSKIYYYKDKDLKEILNLDNSITNLSLEDSTLVFENDLKKDEKFKTFILKDIKDKNKIEVKHNLKEPKIYKGNIYGIQDNALVRYNIENSEIKEVLNLKEYNLSDSLGITLKDNFLVIYSLSSEKGEETNDIYINLDDLKVTKLDSKYRVRNVIDKGLVLEENDKDLNLIKLKFEEFK